MQYKILFVDDETANLRLLERLFRSSYDVYTAASADEGLELLSVHDIELIVSDQRMPGMTGLEFLKLAAERRPQTVRIILTGYTDANDLVDAINSGVVYKYITKPWINEELKQTVKRALQHYESTRAMRRLQTETERLRSRLIAATEGCVEMILALLDSAHPHLRGHAERTAAAAGLIAEGLSEIEWESRSILRTSAMLHEAVLYTAPKYAVVPCGCPTEADVSELTNALNDGATTIEFVPELAEQARVLRFMLERFDGTGQPFGFSGHQVPLMTRIISIACAYDRLRHPATASESAEHDEALNQLRAAAGHRFDPDVVEALAEACAKTGLCESRDALVLS